MKIPCICILCVNVASYEISFLLSVLFIRMLEVGKQAHKILSKGKGRGIHITRCYQCSYSITGILSWGKFNTGKANTCNTHIRLSVFEPPWLYQKYILTGICKLAHNLHTVWNLAQKDRRRHDLALNPRFHSKFCHTALKKSQNKIWNEKCEFEASY